MDDRAAAFDVERHLQALPGHHIWPPFIGHVGALHPLKALAEDWVPPVRRDSES